MSASEPACKKTLVVSWSLPPALVGSSNIIAALAREFSSTEWVLAGEKWPGPDENKWDDEAGRKPAIHYIHRQWPWRFKKKTRLLLFPVVLWRLNRVFKRTQCKQVLGIFPDEYYLFAAYLIARRHRVPLVTYFHNTYIENRQGLKKRFAAWFQPRVFRESKTVFVMSEGMQDFWKERYPGVHFETLVHTFDEPIASSPKIPDPGKPLSIAFMGSLNRSNTDAFGRVREVLQRVRNCRLTTYSGSPDKVFSAVGVRGERVTHTRVAFDQVVEALRRHDLLFFPHGFVGGLTDAEYATIFPTRTIPYLLSGVPIVAHTPPTAFLTRWLKKHDCAEVVEVASGDALVAAVNRLASDPGRCRTISENGLAAVQAFHAPAVISRLRRALGEQGQEAPHDEVTR